MTMPASWNNNDNNNKQNNNTNNNNIRLSRKQKKLLKHKANLEVTLNDVRMQIQREAERQKPSKRKQKKLMDYKTNLEITLQDTWRQIQQEEQKQIDKYLKRYDPQKYKENKELQKVIVNEQYQERLRHEQQQKISGEDKRQVGKALIVFGIFITVISFLAGSFEGGILGFIINIIGIGLLVSGNKDQGRGTTVFGGGFVSTGD